MFWNFWDARLIQPVIDEFEKQNPGVRIRNEQISWRNGLDKIVAAIANQRAPDICELGSTWMGRFMAEGALADVTGYFNDLKPDYLMWEPAPFNGRLYGLPWLIGPRVLFYNRRLFREAGLDPEKPPGTGEERLDAARRIHRPGDGIYGFGMNTGEGHVLYKKFMPLVWGRHGKIFDEDGNFVFTGRQTREALEYYRILRQFSYCEKQDLLDETFRLGRLGLNISGPWNFARYKSAAGNDFAVALMPKPVEKEGFSASFLGGQMLVILKKCRNPSIAASFIRFLARAENTLPVTRAALMNFPADKKAFNDKMFLAEPQLSVFVEQMKTAVHPPVNRMWIEVERIINSTIERCLYGESIDLVFADAEAEFLRVKRRLADSERFADSTPADNRSAGQEIFSGSTMTTTVLVFLIGIGTLVNAGLLFFILCGKSPESETCAGYHFSRSQRPILLLLPWLISFAVFWLYPLAFSLILSFCDYDVFHPDVFRFAGWNNYLRLFADPDFLQSFVNTLIFVIGTAPITAALALILALMVNKTRYGSEYFRSVFFLPSIISIVVIATIFKSFYSPAGGRNMLLEYLGIGARAWLTEKNLALPAIMFMNIWAYTGYYMILYLAALKSVPAQLYEAAQVDGADEWQQFRHITLPNIHYMTVFILTVNSIRNWQIFPEVFTLTRGGPVGSTNTLVHYLYDTAFRYHEMGYASAISYVLLVIVMIFSLVQMRILERKKLW